MSDLGYLRFVAKRCESRGYGYTDVRVIGDTIRLESASQNVTVVGDVTLLPDDTATTLSALVDMLDRMHRMLGRD